MFGLRSKLRARRQGPQEVRIPSGLLEVLREGPAHLAGGAPAAGGEAPLDVAFVIPSFRQVSGGHTTIANLVRALEARGHRCSLWIVDDDARAAGFSDASASERFHEFFGPTAGPVHGDLSGWKGAGVVVATGWQTVPSALLLPGAHARAYLVQDHEPEFYATSAERLWAEWTYRQGLHCLAASPWLAELVAQRYGATATTFDIGVDHDVYRPQDLPRSPDRVLFYVRTATPRRGVPLGLLALEELHRRRPATEIALFGEHRPTRTAFPHVHLGVLSREKLAREYATAAAGLSISLTNPSLVPNEMLACGLPVVEVATDGIAMSYGIDGPLREAALSPVSIASELEVLLEDPAEHASRSAAGVEHVRVFTWERTAEQVEQGLRTALAQRPS